MTLSVAMCTYNGARFVREQLESILDQEIMIDEIVVCDDGSKDETLDIVNSIAENSKNISWKIQQNTPNLGVTKNFEKAISLCSGDIVFLADQDDIWRNDKTRVIINYFEENPQISVVFTDASLINDKGESISNYTLLDAMIVKPNIHLWNYGFQQEILLECPRATGATMAIRKSFITEDFFLIDQNKCLHDEQISYLAAFKGCLGIILDSLISYRQHGNNIIGIPSDNWIYSGIDCPILLDTLLIPRAMNPIYQKKASKRVNFYNTRYRYYPTLFGKVILLLSLGSYISYYKKYWYKFYVSDLKTNLRNGLKNKIWI